MTNPYLRVVPEPCRYDRAGWCLTHRGGQLFHPNVPWCNRGRAVALAVVDVYERRAAEHRRRRDGPLGALLWSQEASRMEQAARMITRDAGGR